MNDSEKWIYLNELPKYDSESNFRFHILQFAIYLYTSILAAIKWIKIYGRFGLLQFHAELTHYINNLAA